MASTNTMISNMSSINTTAASNTTSTEFKPLNNVANSILSNINNDIKKIIELSYSYDKLYNTEYLSKHKNVSAIKKQIIEKLERGYIDDK